MLFSRKPPEMPAPDDALPGRTTEMATPAHHFINGADLKMPAGEGAEEVLFGLGCFWGAERKFWSVPGVLVTAVGYSGGYTANPTYKDICSGQTGHNEVVRVVFDPSVVTFDALLQVFWESHDPTQGMRQGNDVGTQYRSGIYVTTPAQQETAEQSMERYQAALRARGLGSITTEIKDALAFYYAEAEHQQYLARNPAGYCGLGGTGVACPAGLEVRSATAAE